MARCLSIQSHVVHGYVGNKSATFPLQLLGFDVDAINSVHLSNHTGYASFAGQKLGGDDLETVMSGLKNNGLIGSYSHVLTGYVGAETFLRAIISAIRDVKAANPSVVYVCDPVLGDNGRLYVPPSLVPVYRDEVLPLATMLTPNQFEAETLSGVAISDVPSALAAIDALHARGVPSVVMTSSALPAGQEATMLLIASCPWEAVRDEWERGIFAGVDRSASAKARFAVEIPRMDADFTGTGDLTAALLLAHSHARRGSLVAAVEMALATVQAVCARTLVHRDVCAQAAAAQLGECALAVTLWSCVCTEPFRVCHCEPVTLPPHCLPPPPSPPVQPAPSTAPGSRPRMKPPSQGAPPRRPRHHRLVQAVPSRPRWWRGGRSPPSPSCAWCSRRPTSRSRPWRRGGCGRARCSEVVSLLVYPLGRPVMAATVVPLRPAQDMAHGAMSSYATRLKGKFHRQLSRLVRARFPRDRDCRKVTESSSEPSPAKPLYGQVLI